MVATSKGQNVIPYNTENWRLIACLDQLILLLQMHIS